MTSSRRIFIGSAWPYANGPLHLGHIAALLPADVLARYFRQRGDRVFFDSGSDCHGTPITVRAEQEGVEPSVIAERFHAVLQKTFERLGFAYDVYTKTTEPRHEAIVQEIFLKLWTEGLLIEKEEELTFCPKDQRFLPDRYIEGVCPHCGFDRARGDQCDQCKSLLDPLKLKDPHCVLCGTSPVQKKSKHLFFKLPQFQKQLEKLAKSSAYWRDNAAAFTQEFLKKGLIDRAVTRDLTWGVPVPKEIPGYEGKSIYVWFDGVCGYLSAHRQAAEKKGEPDAWKPFWDPRSRSVRQYYVHGKDNIPFHTIIWPAILLGYGGGTLRLPDGIVSSEYLTIEGKKLSTSRNWAIWADDVIERYQPDALRYYLLANGPETRDADFSWEAFVAKTNNELVATYGNFIQRVTALAAPLQETIRSAAGFSQTDRDILKAVERLYDSVGGQIEATEFKGALSEIFSFLKTANTWLNEREPWKKVKTDPEDAARALKIGLDVIVNLVQLTQPFLPFQAEVLRNALGLNTLGWTPLRFQAAIPKIQGLFVKLDPEVIEVERAKLQSAA